LAYSKLVRTFPGSVGFVLLALAAVSAQRSVVAPRQTADAGVAVPVDLGPDDSFTGAPWTGAPGITETVSELKPGSR
jgi:hypothetical protein